MATFQLGEAVQSVTNDIGRAMVGVHISTERRTCAPTVMVRDYVQRPAA